MNEKFFDQKKEKQARMINAALKVFSEYGYYHASTDEIVKNAGISKGLLFHYFNSKLGLYSFLYDYATRVVTLELTQNVEKNETGYFELRKQIYTAKINALSQYPYIFLFLKKAETEDHPEALAEIEDRRDRYNRIISTLLERADITGFNSKADYEKVGNILDYTFDGLMEKNIKSDPFRADFFLEEALEYVDMIKDVTYEEQ
ncbi:TetR/AcrR family transcriptional regulator [Butyrivibrio proteoclasticus]|uniref:TetR/AcrR family transcriptional regulator n=1 Tax=Butyrivibrio proteoclasticus TaxID=43305 RepID=UPI00068551B7|nr:TetR/AcrR family transcriptional regulator [Butyrivibrio proteoclasticus]